MEITMLELDEIIYTVKDIKTGIVGVSYISEKLAKIDLLRKLKLLKLI